MDAPIKSGHDDGGAGENLTGHQSRVMTIIDVYGSDQTGSNWPVNHGLCFDGQRQDSMRTLIEKWGNSLAVRLPKSLASDAHLSEGTVVELQVEGDRLVITPARPKYKLSELLSRFKLADRHGEVDWGGRPLRGGVVRQRRPPTSPIEAILRISLDP